MLIYCDLHSFNTGKNLAARCAIGIFVSLITTIMTYSFIANRGNHHFGISHIYLTVYKSKVPYKRSKRCLMLVSIRTMILNKNNNRLNRKRSLRHVYRKRLMVLRRKNRQGSNRFKGKKLTLLRGNTLFLAGRICVLHLSF